jgi:hypothetical protein
VIKNVDSSNFRWLETMAEESIAVPHPDKRPYPWLATGRREATAYQSSRFLIYQPFAGMCNQFSSLECAVALARTLGRTLVLPRWRPQYGCPWMGSSADYFNIDVLSELVRCITVEQFISELHSVGGCHNGGEGVALCRIHLEYNPTWSSPRGFELYPDLRSLLHELEYFALLEDQVHRSRRTLVLASHAMASLCVPPPLSDRTWLTWHRVAIRPI